MKHMEKEHLYGRDNLVSSKGDLLNQTPLARLMLSRKTPTTTTVKPVVQTTAQKVQVLKALQPVAPTVVKPEIKPVASATLSKPVTANTPLILAPNITGGLKTATPSPVNIIAAKTVESKAVTPSPAPKTSITEMLKASGVSIAPINTKHTFNEQVQAGTIKKIDPAKLLPQAEQAPLQAGGFKLPNIWLILGMLTAVVVMYFIAKRKKG